MQSNDEKKRNLKKRRVKTNAASTIITLPACRFLLFRNFRNPSSLLLLLFRIVLFITYYVILCMYRMFIALIHFILGSNSSSSFSESSEMTIYRTRHRQMALLTPPNSQSSSLNNSSAMSTASVESRENDDQTEFLRAFFYLEHQMRIQPHTGDRMLENEVIRQSILVVVRHVDRSLMELNSNTTIYFPQCLESLRLCVQLLDTHSRWCQTLRETFAQLAEKWLQLVLDVNEPRQQVMKPFALLQVIADSKGLAPRLVESLLKKVAHCQQKLNEWQGSRNELVPDQLIVSFADASYLFVLLETAIARLGPVERNRFLSIPSQLPDVHPHVSLHFPLFALSLMRLQSKLAETTAGEAINNNSN